MRSDRTILLVEDDVAIRESVCECLVGEGYAVVSTGDGAEALERIERDGPPALVLADLVMPIMDGAALVAALRGRGLAGVPVVLMTAAVTGSRSRLPPVEAVLTKPFDLDDLIDTVARLTGGAAAG